MSWVLDGQKVKAKYLGETVTGVVVDSRVKYGGKVQYTVELDSPVQFRWRTEPTDRVLIDNDELLEV
jgi:hypothetical protein